jgi:hypothetical protein
MYTVDLAAVSLISTELTNAVAYCAVLGMLAGALRTVIRQVFYI